MPTMLFLKYLQKKINNNYLINNYYICFYIKNNKQ